MGSDRRLLVSAEDGLIHIVHLERVEQCLDDAVDVVFGYEDSLEEFGHRSSARREKCAVPAE